MSILAGCAMPPGPQSGLDGAALSTASHTDKLLAPPGYSSAAALAALPASGTGNDNSLADAQPIDDNGSDISSFHQLGRASWYGRKFHGRRTANGERYDMHALTAAHRTLPLGSYVRVVNEATKKWVVVKINDRGPFSRGRVIDLSYAAAEKLGLAHVGTARVEIDGLSREAAKEARAEMVAENANTGQ